MQTDRRLVIGGAVVGTFLAALDVTVIGTAMPTIVGQLGGLSLYSWAFSSYLLTSTVTVPLYGKGADLFGRKPAYLLAVAIFVLGSIACAFAWSMESLIVFRAIQGLGAGGVLPVTTTIVGDLYPAEQRAKVQGLFASVWASSSVIGPAAGALIVETWSWPVIFWINLPFGAVAASLIVIALHEHVPRRAHRIDALGAALLTASSTLLMWALIEGAAEGLLAPGVLGAAGASVVLSAAFWRQELRHPEPMVPPELLNERAIVIAVLAGTLTGVLLYGVTSYVPPFIQGVLGGDPADAGAAVIPLGVGWPAAAWFSGRLLKRLGYRRTAMIGGVLLLLGGLPFFAVERASRLVLLAGGGLIGLGLGFSASVLLIAAQEVVPWHRRGSATAMVQFSRTIGGAIGVAGMGAVLTRALERALGGQPELFAIANRLLDPRARASVPLDAAASITQALSSGLSGALFVVGIAGALSLVVISAFPRNLAVGASAQRAPPPPH